MQLVFASQKRFWSPPQNSTPLLSVFLNPKPSSSWGSCNITDLLQCNKCYYTLISSNLVHFTRVEWGVRVKGICTIDRNLFHLYQFYW